MPAARRILDRLTPDPAEVRGLVVLLVSAAAATLVVVGRGAWWPSGAPGAEPGSGAAPEALAAAPTAAPAPLFVHVAGAVHAPGVVELPRGARVAAAIGEAGGATADADLAALNLARVLDDGERVLVPTRAPPGAVPSVGAAAPADTARTPDGRVDLNGAPAEVLEELPGVGPVLAARIVAWREANGPFASLDDLVEVSGIGPRVLAGLRDAAAVP